jgi:hypothetical protein
MHVIDAPAPSIEEKNMEFTQKIRARIIGTLLLIFSIAFVSVPIMIGGHPGETVSHPQRTIT